MHKNRWLSLVVWILVLALLGGCIWYFFVFNHDVPAYLWNQVADFYNDHGMYPSAARCYGKVVKNDPQCGTDLLYKASYASAESENYTKAEYYLALAIRNYPQELDSYLRLSSLYVAEDKLLDAVELIDNCSSSMSSALESLRPAAPVIQPEESFSQEPVTVSLSFSEGTTYYSIGSDYPSVMKGRYDGGFDIGYGFTRVSALVVGDNGLVSRLSSSEYTIRGEISTLDIQDAAMDETIRQAIGAGRYDELTTDMLWNIDSLSLPYNVSDYSALSNCISIKELQLGNSNLDFSLLSQFQTLSVLDCHGLQLNDGQLYSIGQLSGLKSLNLSGCGLDDISYLSGLDAIETLNLSGNQISDIAPLSSMKALTSLDISGNNVTSLSALTGISGLSYFNGSGCRFGNLGAFAANTELTYLNISDCGVSELTPLENNLDLVELYASNNLISFIDPLEKCSSIETLSLSNNRIESISSITLLTKLRFLDVSDNLLTELPFFSSLTDLTSLDLSGNEIDDLSVLSSLHKLNTLSINSTFVTELSPVADLSSLVTVNAKECEIHDPEKVTSRSIILNYDPGFELPKPEPEENEEAIELED